ncbi:MAG: hypothetical protein BWX50_01353 [Euryarchaeota archaeon ADurb.Bin009]|nr:MAG: hypothetical protein BWX50_01353 [Euryarchaeota archaeon ADurb.Bin009]
MVPSTAKKTIPLGAVSKIVRIFFSEFFRATSAFFHAVISRRLIMIPGFPARDAIGANSMRWIWFVLSSMCCISARYGPAARILSIFRLIAGSERMRRFKSKSGAPMMFRSRWMPRALMKLVFTMRMRRSASRMTIALERRSKSSEKGTWCAGVYNFDLPKRCMLTSPLD